MKHNLEELLVMVISVDLQGFIVEKGFFIKEVTVLKRGTILILYIFSYYIFTLYFFMSYAMALFEIRQILRFLIECLSSWIAMSDGMVPYDSNASNYEAMIEENEALVHVKGQKNRNG